MIGFIRANHIGVLAVAWAMCGWTAPTGSVQGHVRDASGAAAVAAEIQIRTTSSNHPDKIVKVRADAQGVYRCPALPAGTYIIHAETKGAGSATSAPFSLGNEAKTIDLILEPVKAAAAFFDEPKFTVAGVTDNTYSGGHGSETVVRSAESMTEATAALGRNSAARSNLSNKQSLREELIRLQQALKRKPEAGELHHQVAEAEEKTGSPVAAVHEYQRAAELDPSEVNLFDWATELLVHGAPDAAGAIYLKGVQQFPRSSRLLLGSGVALYAAGRYTEAASRFFQATDVHPSDSEPYLLLCRAQRPEIVGADGFLGRLKRWVELQPENAAANCNYATYLWTLRKHPDDPATFERAQALLEKAIRIDPKLASGYLQLGILYSDTQKFPAAISALQDAVALDPTMERAHYRLAQAYRSVGDQPEAKRESDLFQQLSKASTEQVDRQRSEMQKFVVTLKSPEPH